MWSSTSIRRPRSRGRPTKSPNGGSVSCRCAWAARLTTRLASQGRPRPLGVPSASPSCASAWASCRGSRHDENTHDRLPSAGESAATRPKKPSIGTISGLAFACRSAWIVAGKSRASTSMVYRSRMRVALGKVCSHDDYLAARWWDHGPLAACLAQRRSRAAADEQGQRRRGSAPEHTAAFRDARRRPDSRRVAG